MKPINEVAPIQNHLNYEPSDHPGEINLDPSETVPDQSMSVKELMDRYARGLPLNGKTPVYTGEDDDMPDLARMDLAEREEYAERVAQELEEIKERLNKRAKEIEDIKKLKADSEELRKLKAAANKVTTEAVVIEDANKEA